MPVMFDDRHDRSRLRATGDTKAYLQNNVATWPHLHMIDMEAQETVG